MTCTNGGEGNKGGHPSVYSDVLVDRILERISAGEPLQKICEDADMPACSNNSSDLHATAQASGFAVKVWPWASAVSKLSLKKAS